MRRLSENCEGVLLGSLYGSGVVRERLVKAGHLTPTEGAIPPGFGRWTREASRLEDAQREEDAVGTEAVQRVGLEFVGQTQKLVPGEGAFGRLQEITRLPVIGRLPTSLLLS